MNWLYWVLEFVKAVSWPLAIVALSLLFRKEIRSLVEKVVSVKVAGIEATFARTLENIDREFARTAPRFLKRTEVGPTAKYAIERDERDYLYGLAEIQPSAAILEAWNEIEFALREAAHRRNNDIEVKTPLPAILYVLFGQEKGAQNLYLPIRELEVLKNMVVHASQPTVTAETARNYVRTTGSVLNRINAELK
jgi:hypothetical protein